MHRFVWNLTWSSSGGPGVDEESEYRNPSGPKVVPGIYTVTLTVDGRPQTQPLKVLMDPRSACQLRRRFTSNSNSANRYSQKPWKLVARLLKSLRYENNLSIWSRRSARKIRLSSRRWSMLKRKLQRL